MHIGSQSDEMLEIGVAQDRPGCGGSSPRKDSGSRVAAVVSSDGPRNSRRSKYPAETVSFFSRYSWRSCIGRGFFRMKNRIRFMGEEKKMQEALAGNWRHARSVCGAPRHVACPPVYAFHRLLVRLLPLGPNVHRPCPIDSEQAQIEDSTG